MHFLAYRDFEIVFDDSFVKFDIVEHNMKIFFKYSTIYPMQYESRKILLSNTKYQELNVLKYLNMMLKKAKEILNITIQVYSKSVKG